MGCKDGTILHVPESGPRLAPSGLSVSCAMDVRVMLLQLMQILG